TTVVSIMLIVLVYLGKFATTTYKTIPAHLGGGKFNKIRLVLDSDHQLINELQQAGIPLTARTANDQVNLKNEQEAKSIKRTTDEVDLVLVTDAEYFIMGNATAVSVPKGIVKAVLYKHPTFGWKKEVVQSKVK